MSLAVIDRGSGHPVVLLHGQPGSGASWEQVTDLLEPEFRVLAPDRAGYGATRGEARGVHANAELVARLLTERDARPATVVGHSWSGAVAVLLAAGWPELVSDLVLVGAACTSDSIDALDRLLTVPVLGDTLTVVGLVAMTGVLPRARRLVSRAPEEVRDRLFAALPDETLLGTTGGSLGRSRRTFAVEQRALLEELPDVTAALADLELPTTVVAGEWDLVVRPRAAATLAAAVRGSELVLLPRTGHFVARDAPKALAALITASAGKAASH